MRKKRCDRNHLIYVINCNSTNEQYIGVTVMKGTSRVKTLSQRWQGHLYKALVLNEDWSLPQAIRKYGSKNFTINALKTVRGKKPAFMAEALLINDLKTKLNTRIKSY